jgi:hypothetical protein
LQRELAESGELERRNGTGERIVLKVQEIELREKGDGVRNGTREVVEAQAKVSETRPEAGQRR